MKIHVALAFFLVAGFPSAVFGERQLPPDIDPTVIHKFTFSLLELRERTQHKHLEKEDIDRIAKLLKAATFEKKVEHQDVARTAYISRYQFLFSFLGGTPRSGDSESGMLTIDCRTLYWNDSIYTIDKDTADKIRKILPQPANPLTRSERPYQPLPDR